MLPGLVLVLGLAAIYRQLNLQDPLLAAAFLGVQIGVVALVVRALHRIADHVLGGAALWAIALVSLAGALLGVAFWLILPVAGIGYALLRAGRSGFAAAVLGGGILLTVMMFAAPAPVRETANVLASTGTVPALALFLSGLKAGLLTFGGAYSAIPFVREDAVGRGWVEEGQFLDALALSGIIPAPLIIFATFVGFLAGGLPGALAMTAGIFLPAFTFGTVLHGQIERLVEEQRLRHLLEGVAAAVVGLIAATAVQLLAQVGGDLRSPVVGALIFAPALLLLYRWRSKLNVLAVVVASAVAGAAFLR
jgi:chromate transporter